MIYRYVIRYYHGHNSDFKYTDEDVYESDTERVVGVTFQPASPALYGEAYYKTDETKTITYKPLNKSNKDTLGIRWTEKESIYRKYSTSEWSSFPASSLVRLGELNWQSDGDSGDTVKCYIHPTYKVLGNKYVQLTLPKEHTFDGYYSVSDVHYLIVDDGFGGDKKYVSLDSEVYHKVVVDHWNSGKGNEWEPGETVMLHIDETANTYYGPYDYLDHYRKDNAKTYQQLLADVIRTQRDEDYSFQVNLKSNPEYVHDSETLTVNACKKYEFLKWKTDSGDLNLSSKPSIRNNLNVYAEWNLKDTIVETTFPLWTTEQLVPDGDDSIRHVTLRCYEKAGGNEYYSKQLGVYVSKQGKHVKWSDSTTEYDVGNSIPLQENADYTAVWVADELADAIESIPGNTTKIPDPPRRPGYTYLGVASSATAKAPEYDPGAEINVESDVNLYAVWKANGSGQLFNGTEYKMYQIYIYDGKDWKLYLPKIYNGNDWNTVYM